MLHSAKLANTDNFKLLRKQFLLSDHHLRLAAAPDVRVGLATIKPPPPAHTWAQYCVEVEAWNRLETPVVSSLAKDDTPSQVTVNAAMESPQKQDSYSTERALNKVLELLTKIHTPPQKESPYRQRRKEQQEGWKDFRERRDESERRHGDGHRGKDKGRGRSQHDRGGRDDRASSSSSSHGDRNREKDTRDTRDRRYGNKRDDSRDGRKRAYAAVADKDDEDKANRSDGSRSSKYIEHPDHDYVAMSATGKVPRDYDTSSSEDERR
jgi:hypothetical protein